MLHKINDPEFIALVEKGVPLETLQRRLWPLLDKHGDWDEHTKEFTEAELNELDTKSISSETGFWGNPNCYWRSYILIGEQLKDVERHTTR